jgi:hypothetical protein
MSYTDTIARVTQITTEVSNLQTAFTPAAASPAKSTTATPGASMTFSSALAGAMSPTATAATAAATGVTAATPSGGVATSGQSLPPRASSMLSSGQQQFASRLAADTGMDSGVVSAWLLAEESGGAATSRQSAGNHDWLNIGYTDSGTYGSADSVWSNPVTAADATAGWLKGQSTIPGYGNASSGIQAILGTAGQPPATQIAAIQQSGWASSGYPDLPSLLQQIVS